MDWFEALILGLLQGLTEFLPVSSSGHLELGKALFGVESGTGLEFTLAVHGATVLSTLVVFRQELIKLGAGVLQFRYNEETRYVLMLVLSMIPVGIAGFLLKEKIELLFSGRIVMVGAMLVVTAGMLFLTILFKDKGKKLTYLSAFIIGLAQAVAVVPGISRSGATISTGMILGIRRDAVAGFSFLMVLLPVIGANLLEVPGSVGSFGSTGILSMMAGFCGAFFSGLIACRVMINLVRRSRMWCFSIYCVLAGVAAIILG